MSRTIIGKLFITKHAVCKYARNLQIYYNIMRLYLYTTHNRPLLAISYYNIIVKHTRGNLINTFA